MLTFLAYRKTGCLMKKIYMIVSHKVTKAMCWTIDYLSSFEENIILIHYDKKSNINDVTNFAKNYKNVYLLEDRVDVQWATFSQVIATIKLLEYASKFDYEYAFLISGDDVPVVANKDVNQFLQQNYGKEFIHYQDERNNFVNPIKRIAINYPSIYFVRNPSVSVKILKKLLYLLLPILFSNKKVHLLNEKNILKNYYKGTNWFTLTKKTAEWILDYINKNIIVMDSFKNSIYIDEVFFHSLLMLKPDLNLYDDKSKINNALRYTDWTTGPQYPRLLDLSDLEKINNTFCFFARKINDSIDCQEFSSFKKLVLK